MSTRFDAPETAPETDDASDTRPPPRAQTWRERHALKLLGGVMVAMFTLVIVAQVAC